MKITHERSCDEQIPNAFDTLTTRKSGQTLFYKLVDRENYQFL
jgi:hypothetical protein